MHQLPDTLISRHFYLGADIGQVNDYSATALVEKSVWLTGDRCPIYFNRPEETRYAVRSLRRFPLHTPYPEIGRRICQAVRTPDLQAKATLIIDATGIGRAVFDIMNDNGNRPQCNLVPIILTAGDSTSYKGSFICVPKRDVMMSLLLMFHNGILRISSQCAEAPSLIKELESLRVKMLPSGREAFGTWRENEHDDLVLALALACWKVQGVH